MKASCRLQACRHETLTSLPGHIALSERVPVRTGHKAQWPLRQFGLCGGGTLFLGQNTNTDSSIVT
jgi:hypothetical protein